MAISSTPINGNLMYLYLDGTQVLRATNITISGTTDMIDVTSQTSAGDRDILPGLRSWNGSADIVVVMDENIGAKEIAAALTAETQYGLKLIQMTSTGTHVHGDYYWHGDCYISGYTVTAAPNDKVTFSFTFEGDGALTCTAYT